jgi:hypothetical protein
LSHLETRPTSAPNAGAIWFDHPIFSGSLVSVFAAVSRPTDTQRQ